MSGISGCLDLGLRQLPRRPEDGGGGEAIKPRQVITTMMGTNINVNFTTPGIYFTETNVLDAASNTMGIVRKTIVIGDSDINSSVATVRSAADADDDDFEVEPREVGDETDNVISFTSMSGSFKFTTSNFDKVAFTGKVGLPAGYTPKNVAGNDIHIGMGNVGDIIHLDAQRQADSPDAERRHYPLQTHPAETHQRRRHRRRNGPRQYHDELRRSRRSSATTRKGVTVNVRSDEEGQSSVARFIQVDMLISGKTYSVLAPVNYKVSAMADSAKCPAARRDSFSPLFCFAVTQSGCVHPPRWDLYNAAHLLKSSAPFASCVRGAIGAS